MATTQTPPKKEKQPTLLGSFLGTNTRARDRRGAPTGEVFEGTRRFW